MKLPFQVLEPPTRRLTALRGIDPLRGPILPSFRSTGRPRLAEAGDRILLPGIQLRQIQPLLTAPATPCRLIHCCCDDHRLQPCRRRPARAAAARPIGQGIRPPTLQRRHAYPDLTRHMLHRRTLRRQQPRHYRIFVRLSVSSHFLLPRPQRFRSYPGGNFSDTGGLTRAARSSSNISSATRRGITSQCWPRSARTRIVCWVASLRVA